MGDPVTWSLIIAGTSTAANVVSQRKSRKERRRAAEIQKRRRDIDNRRAALASIEQGRQLSGQIVNTAAQTGGLGGSGAQGAVGSISTQTASNLTFNEQLLSFAEATEKHLEKASLYDWQSQTFTALANMSLQYGSYKASQ